MFSSKISQLLQNEKKWTKKKFGAMFFLFSIFWFDKWWTFVDTHILLKKNLVFFFQKIERKLTTIQNKIKQNHSFHVVD
jgi:hypothetical protein